MPIISISFYNLPFAACRLVGWVLVLVVIFYTFVGKCVTVDWGKYITIVCGRITIDEWAGNGVIDKPLLANHD